MRQPKNLKDKLKRIFGKPTRGCGHDENHWCDKCFNVPTAQEFTLPNGEKTKGYFISNL